METTFQIELIGLQIFCSASDQRLSPLDAERYFHLFGNRSCDFVLHLKNILQFAIVTLGPDVVSIDRIDELRDDANPVPGLADAAL